MRLDAVLLKILTAQLAHLNQQELKILIVFVVSNSR
jgi:hypothetical protein